MWLEQETLAGAIVRTVVVGSAPLSVAVDERSGHAFVLSRSADSPDAASVSMIDTVTGVLLRTQAVVTDVWGWMPPWLRRWLPFVSQRRRRIPSVSGRASVLDLSRL
jgi:hypothetical protein